MVARERAAGRHVRGGVGASRPQHTAPGAAGATPPAHRLHLPGVQQQLRGAHHVCRHPRPQP